MIGRTLAHYRITAAIGTGGMGQVYRATDTKLGRDVALKVLPAEMAASPEMTERFRREARAVAALNHPNIVTIYSVEDANGLHFLTMELVQGRSLDQLIPEGGLDVQRILDIANALSGALAEAHDKGIVHRDLKPANVMVTNDGVVKVLDFGLAKFQGPEPGNENSELSTAMKTSAGVVMGTRPYMSPEQVQGRTLDHRTDIFSMGVVLYEISTGKRPFHGQSGADLFASILRDTVPPVTETRSDLPADLSRVIRRCLEKDPRHRIQTARDIGNELRDSGRSESQRGPIEATVASAREGSGGARTDESFRVAVLPFKYSGTNPDLTALAEGLSEEIVTGLSRFSYLRVLAHGSTQRYANETVDVRAAGREIGARYVMEGSLRQAGPMLRIAVQLVDATSGAHLWAETYNRPFAPEEIFALQDELVPRIVSTIADTHGVLPRSMSEALRSRPPEQLSPYEAVLRSFGYFDRITAEELDAARAGLEAALRKAPANADAWSMLALLNVQEYAQRFNLRPDSLQSGLVAARRAVEAAPSSHLAHFSLAQALFFRKDLPSFRNAAERAASLNPMDGNSIAFLGELLTYSGDSERGLALAERAKQLNPHHPGWYWYANFYDAYRRGDDRAAVGFAIKVNMPGHWGMHFMKAAACGQLGDRETAGRALQEVLKLRPDFAITVRDDIEKWWDKDYCDRLIDGLREAGLALAAGSGGEATPSLSTPTERATVAIAVLPFSDLSPGKDQEYLCEGMAEEVMSALMGIEGMRVASRTSTFRARQDNSDLPAIARALSVSHVLEGSVRTAGSRLRVTAQLTDVATGFQLWSERFDRDAVDVFAVQDEIAAGVVGAVRARLASGAAGAVPARSQVTDLEAYRHYLQGRHLRYSKNDHRGALRCFEAALALDPSHALSMVGLAEVHVLLAIYSLAPSRESYATARAAIEKAKQLQGETSEALYVLGMISICEHDWAAGEGSLLRAIELEPHSVRALCWLANAVAMRGRLDEARKHLASAREIDPLAPYPYAMSGFALMVARQAGEAMPLIEQALAFDPDYNLALWNSSLALCAAGRVTEAVSAIERAATSSHSGGFLEGIRGWVLARAGRLEEARAILTSLQSRPATAPAVVSEGWLLAALGDADAAFAVFERATQECQQSMTFWGLPPFDTVRDDPRFGALLTKLGLQRNAEKTSPPVPSSGEARADEGFWVAVLPFKSSGAADLSALADGLSEEVVTGLSRFSYLRVISRGATSRLASGATDLRAVAKEIGARYVMEGSLRQSGGRLRVAVQLTDAATGAHLWAETYDRPFNVDDVFALQDDLVPRIVSTVADQHGVLPHSMSALIRNKSDDQLTPLEAVLRVFSFHERMTPEEHRNVRALLEHVVREHPDEGDCWAMLATLYADEFMFGFEGEVDPLARAQKAARRAVEVAPTSWLAAQALAQSLFFRRELQAFRPVAERTIALNPMDSAALAFISLLLALSGDWDRGLEVSSAARSLNPHFPGWYWLTPIFHAYHKRDYRGAIEAASRINIPGYFWGPAACASAFGKLGEGAQARKALNELLAIRPDFAATARDEFGKWFDREFLDHFIEGLAKAGLAVEVVPGTSPEPAGPSPKASDPKVAIAVLPFSDMSPAKDQEYLCEGMAEEIMNALGGIKGIRVASRTSTFRAGRDYSDLPAIARALSVTHVLEGSVRTSGARLRVTAQLTDIATGYHLWSERFDREATDVFAVQDEISAGVVEAVRVRLSPGASAIHARPQAPNLEAYRSYLKGRHLRGKEDNVGAMAAYEEALRLEPSHAPSWTGLAESTVLAAHFNIIPAREACASARRAVAAAVELEGESANTRHVEAFIALLERRFSEMEAAWRRAIELQPTHVLALGSFGISLCARERFDEGLALLARAREADPLASFPCMLTGFGLLERGRAEEAQRYLADALSFEKEDAAALYISGAALVALGRSAEGIHTIRHAVEMTGRAAHFVGVLGWALATAGETAEARVLLDELRARPKDAPALTAEAWLLGALGETDSAFEVIARAENENQANLYYTGFPGFDALRADPRFAAFRERLGLSPNRTS